MNFSEIGDWVLAYWFELGSLALQGAILATVAWYGRKAFRFLHGSQANEPKQAKASAVMPSRRSIQAIARVSGNAVRHLGAPLASAWRYLANWLQAPTGGSMAPVRRVKRWLQAPTHS